MKPTGMQALLLVIGGLALAWLVATAPPLFAMGAAGALVFSLLFLQRPEIGVLLVLILRASSDAMLQMFQADAPIGSIGGLLNPNTVLVLLLLVAGGMTLLGRSLPIIALPAGRLLALMALTGFIGVLRASSQIASANEWLPLVTSLVAYALASNLFRTERQQRWFVDALALSFILPAVLGFRQLLTGGSSFQAGMTGLLRVQGTFVHPNAFAFYLVIMFTVFLCQFTERTGIRRNASLVIVLASSVLLVATYTRIAWVAVLVVLIAVGLLRSRMLLVFVPAGLAAAYFLVPSIGLRLQNPFEGSFADRLRIWAMLIQRWLEVTGETEAPVAVALDRLVGLGPGAFISLLTTVFPHNDYLRVLVEYGVLGLLLYISVYIILFVTTYPIVRQGRRGGTALPLAFLSLVLAFPIISLTDNVFAMTVNQLYFWTIAGLAVGARYSSTSIEKSTSTKSYSLANYAGEMPSMSRARHRGIARLR